MAPIDLNRLRVLAAVHERGSFSAAAASLGLPRSTISRAIAALEAALGDSLFHRTTRRITITEEARVLLDRIGPSLAIIDSALRELPGPEEEPRGTLKITSTSDLGAMVLAEAVARFTARWPRVRVDVVLTARVLDLARDGFDLALRVAGTRLAERALVVRKVGTLKLHIYGAPGYLARRGAPRSAAELRGHDWVGHRGFPHRDLGLDAAPRVIGDDMFFVREAIRRGAGLGVMPIFLAGDGIAAGELVRVLPHWAWSSGQAYLVRPQLRHVPARTRAFADVLVEVLRRNPL